MNLIDILVFVALGAVFITLVAGIYTLNRGGEFAKKYSNKLMRLRIVLQLTAIVLLALAFFLST